MKGVFLRLKVDAVLQIFRIFLSVLPCFSQSSLYLKKRTI